MGDKEARKEYMKSYYATNKEVINARTREHYEVNKEVINAQKKEYYKANKEAINAHAKEYRETHKEVIKEYRETHKEAINAHAKEYRETNCKCKSCGLFITDSRTNYLCSYCKPGSSTRQRTKEAKIKEFLESNSINFINNKQFENNCCLKYRPDFVIDCVTYYLIIEVDENAHSSYDKDCEIIRMNNISSGIGLPVKFIRYNPDLKGIESTIKQDELLKVVQANMNKEFMEDLSVVYLFY